MPVSRGDAYGLAQEFEAAMAVVDHQGGGTETRREAAMSPMQNDLHALQVTQEPRELMRSRSKSEDLDCTTIFGW